MKTTRTINNKVYDVESFHPTAYEDGLYTVRFHDHGEEYLDRFNHSTMVKAKSEEHAIELAIKDIKL